MNLGPLITGDLWKYKSNVDIFSIKSGPRNFLEFKVNTKLWGQISQ